MPILGEVGVMTRSCLIGVCQVYCGLPRMSNVVALFTEFGLAYITYYRILECRVRGHQGGRQ